jgi:hypothetical protein
MSEEIEREQWNEKGEGKVYEGRIYYERGESDEPWLAT